MDSNLRQHNVRLNILSYCFTYTFMYLKYKTLPNYTTLFFKTSFRWFAFHYHVHSVRRLRSFHVLD